MAPRAQILSGAHSEVGAPDYVSGAPRGVAGLEVIEGAAPGGRDPSLIFEPSADGGFCRLDQPDGFIHQGCDADPTTPCDQCYDLFPRDFAGYRVAGGQYGPYVITRFTRGGGLRTTVHYLMSTWNPYEVVLMRSMFKLELCSSVPRDDCRHPAVSGQASLLLKNNVADRADRLVSKWRKGSVTTKSDFGDPTTTADYALCLYDASGVRLSLAAPAADTCGKKPCWTEKLAGLHDTPNPAFVTAVGVASWHALAAPLHAAEAPAAITL